MSSITRLPRKTPASAAARAVAAWLFTIAGVIFTIIGLFMALSAIGLVMERSAR